MEVKNYLAFEYVKEDRKYQLIIPQGAHLGEVYEAAANFVNGIANLIKEQAEKAQPIEPKKEPDEKKEEKEK